MIFRVILATYVQRRKHSLTRLGAFGQEHEGIDALEEGIKEELKELALGLLNVHSQPSLPLGPLTGKP